MNKYVPVIGLEVHIEQNTKSKMFCQCPADHFGKKANTQTCPVCLALPGALPYPNREAIENTIRFGIAFGCKIATDSKFDRKHYFYPDLPKGYQISQYDMPLCKSGSYSLFIGEKTKTINIKRIHLEEDTGKSVHTSVEGEKVTLIDFNRSGVPLMEMVTDPDFTSVEEVDSFLKETQLIVRTLEISSADMEKGSMRLEANISMRPQNDKDLPSYKVELKNINSFRFLKNAIEAEIERQTELLQKGEIPKQETRGYDEGKKTTFSQRSKEDSQDYRYFPEPDIPPLTIEKSVVDKIKKSLPELPSKKRQRYMEKLNLPIHYIEVLVGSPKRAEYFDKALLLAEGKLTEAEKIIASAMVNQNLDQQYFKPSDLITKLIEENSQMYLGEKETLKVVNEVISENAEAVEELKNGKVQILGFLIGQVQKKLKGKADPKIVSRMISEVLGS